MRVVYCTAVINNPEVVYSSFFRNTASAPFAVLAANNIHGCIYSANDEGMVRGSADVVGVGYGGLAVTMSVSILEPELKDKFCVLHLPRMR